MIKKAMQPPVCAPKVKEFMLKPKVTGDKVTGDGPLSP